jgi:hypothetical protein
MFPNIPQRFIIRELDRASGVLSTAVDALVLINPDFSSDASPVLSDVLKFGGKVTHQAIIQEINSKSHEHQHESPVEQPLIDRKDWENTDAKVRLSVLANCKKAMLLKAREAFRKSNENN